MANDATKKRGIFVRMDTAHYVMALVGTGLLIGAIAQVIWGWSSIPWWGFLLTYLLLGVETTIGYVEVGTCLNEDVANIKTLALIIIWAPLDVVLRVIYRP